MKKLINVPDEIHEILKDYKKATGIPVSAYIQDAILRRMIHDRLLTIFRTKLYLDPNGKIITEEKMDKYRSNCTVGEPEEESY